MKSNFSGKMNRINDEIQMALSSLLRSIKDPRVQQGMISVVGVDTTPDYKFCKVYLSVLGLKDEKEFKKGLKSASGWLRRELGRAVSLRYTPVLVFELDHSIEHGARINKLINELGISAEEGEDAQS